METGRHGRDGTLAGFDARRLERIGDWMARYVGDGRLAGAQTLLWRRGALAFARTVGFRDLEAGTPWQADTVARIYSMTKPVTALALMMLYEEGLFHLDDRVSAILPEFANARVLRPGAGSLDETVPAKIQPTIHHLLTHTAGLSYGMNAGPVADVYRQEKLGTDMAYGGLDRMVRRIAALPLEFEPGTRWHYSVASDVVGRIVEVVSGQSLPEFLAGRVFAPLGMRDTAFEVPDTRLDRFAALYGRGEEGGLKRLEGQTDSAQRAGRVDTHLGGAGLVSTAADYMRFAEMLRLGGRAGAERLIGPRTLAFMTANHLPGDLASMGPKTWCETSFEGVGFGLGVSVMLDPVKAVMAGSPGDFGWGGMASTVFIVDPREEMSVVFLTQLVPSDAYPLRKELRTLIHQAIAD
ncbi:MAG: serine hydrolase domain-containing protein [Hyphomicrobiaceae bacterium]